jgi:uncharacterized protein YbbC (DUF1343 family)
MNVVISIIAIFVSLALIDQLLYLDITGMGWKSAKLALPGFARKYDLAFEPAFQKHQMGMVHGLYHARLVSIEPDHRAVIKIELPRLSAIRLSSASSLHLHIQEGMIPFETGNKYMDRYLHTRLSPAPFQIHSEAHRSKLYEVEKITKRWKSKLRYLKLSDGVLTCSFKYGQAT